MTAEAFVKAAKDEKENILSLYFAERGGTMKRNAPAADAARSAPPQLHKPYILYNDRTIARHHFSGGFFHVEKRNQNRQHRPF